jgi:hypothetical protein
VRLANLVKLGLALWIARWLAAEFAVRYARPAEIAPDGPLPGSFE